MIGIWFGELKKTKTRTTHLHSSDHLGHKLRNNK